MPGRGKGKTQKKRPRETEDSDHGSKRQNLEETADIINLATVDSAENGGAEGNKISPSGIIHFDTFFQGLNLTKSSLDTPEIEEIRCGGDDITAHVPKLIKEKILNLQYINLALLLKGSTELSDICSGSTLHINEKGGIEARPRTTKQTVKSIEEWTDAFIIYASIICTRYPEKGIELFKYMSVIRDASKHFSNTAWKTYDEQFRLRQANLQTRLPWGNLNNELWLRIMSAANSPSLTSQTPTIRPITSPFTCNDFNFSLCTRSVCKFKHACAACNSTAHPKTKCPHLNQNYNSQQFNNYQCSFRFQRPTGRGQSLYGRGRPVRRT